MVALASFAGTSLKCKKDLRRRATKHWTILFRTGRDADHHVILLPSLIPLLLLFLLSSFPFLPFSLCYYYRSSKYVYFYQ